MKLNALKDPFPPGDIEWRIQSSDEKDGKIWARCIAYVTNRAIMNRLDDVVGPDNWRNEYGAAPCGGVMCGISIRVPVGTDRTEWVTKWDGAENTDIEGVKGGLSGAMKRAAVQWGIGRYLYSLDAGWASVHTGGAESAKTKSGKWFKWDPPSLPVWALPHGPVEAMAEAVKNAAAEQPATKGQHELIRKMIASHVITAAERDLILAKLDAGAMSKLRALDAIDWLQGAIPSRRAAEKAEVAEAAAEQPDAFGRADEAKPRRRSPQESGV